MTNKLKGFTLIELMIAIAIIGILALVLIPRVGNMKNQARIAGIQTNLRTAGAKGQIVLEEYESRSIDQVEDALAERLYTNNDSKDMKNPVTNAAGCIDLLENPLSDSAAFAYFSDDDEVGYSRYEDMGENEDFAGIILYDVFINTDNTLAIKFVPMDENGAPLANMILEVSK